MSEPRQTLLEFPCEFPVKAFVKSGADAEAMVVGLVRRHAPDLAQEDIASRASGGGKYTALTLNIHAQSQDQLDAIYQDLTDSPDVIMAL
jgi:putative lipoic acid-binding regulatory protein